VRSEVLPEAEAVVAAEDSAHRREIDETEGTGVQLGTPSADSIPTVPR
jgi:hypothetical protein